MAATLAFSRPLNVGPTVERKPFSLARMRSVFQQAAKPAMPPEQLRMQLQDLQERQANLKRDALDFLHMAHLDVSSAVFDYKDWRTGRWQIPLWKRILYRTGASLGTAVFAVLPIAMGPDGALVIGFTLMAATAVVMGSIVVTVKTIALTENTFQLWRTRRQLTQNETAAGTHSDSATTP